MVSGHWNAEPLKLIIVSENCWERTSSHHPNQFTIDIYQQKQTITINHIWPHSWDVFVIRHSNKTNEYTIKAKRIQLFSIINRYNYIIIIEWRNCFDRFRSLIPNYVNVHMRSTFEFFISMAIFRILLILIFILLSIR